MSDMDQSDIDALLSGLGGEGEQAPIESTPVNSMDQSDIDGLLNTSTATSNTMDQSDIDSLLGGVSTDTVTSEQSEGEVDLESLIAEIDNTSTATGHQEVNLEDLMSELQSDSALSTAGVITSQEEIQALLDGVPASSDSSGQTSQESIINIDSLLDMKLTLTFEVGRSKMAIGDLLSLGQGSVIELHRLVGEDLDLFVSGKLIARGEVVVVNEKFGVRILDIVPPSQRIIMMAGMDQLD